jgi:hypothetical protein
MPKNPRIFPGPKASGALQAISKNGKAGTNSCRPFLLLCAYEPGSMAIYTVTFACPRGLTSNNTGWSPVPFNALR